MPRVNRDLQRRMAARRERERRRPGGTERRYRFAAPPEPEVEPDETLVEDNLQEERTEAVAEAPSPPSRVARGAAKTKAEPAPTRTSDRPFSAYKEEYAYVYGDLRRVGAVVGLLLVALVVLYFVLPLLVR